MIRLPSVKTIERDLADCKEDAKEIRKIMERWCHRPEKMLDKVNAFLGACGVEYLDSNDGVYNEDTGVHYVNMGDTYIPTLCYDALTDRIFVSCWGDIVEKNPKRFER